MTRSTHQRESRPDSGWPPEGGLLLQEDEYEIPLLQTLIKLNGGAPMNQVLTALEPKLKEAKETGGAGKVSMLVA